MKVKMGTLKENSAGVTKKSSFYIPYKKRRSKDISTFQPRDCLSAYDEDAARLSLHGSTRVRNVYNLPKLQIGFPESDML